MAESINPTDKEKHFIDIVQITKNPRAACDVVYPSSNLTNVMRDSPKIKRAIVKILNKSGLKEKYLCGEIKKVIDSTEDDHAKLRAIEMAFKLHGSFAPQEIDIKADFDVWRHLSIEDIKGQIAEIVEEPESQERV